MECPICYETVADDNEKRLECFHSLCIKCYDRLLTPLCPMCRHPIVSGTVQIRNEPNDLESVDSFVNETYILLESRPRRRRRRRNREERRNTRENIPIEIETLDEIYQELQQTVSTKTSNNSRPNKYIIQSKHIHNRSRYQRN